ncbi:MAG TPA: helix-turn-helix transcriptional regulator [Terriglobales bacterium]|nr:helix-turn-helix transcriptional regulator [Terriglobales bacterium]
MPVTHVGLYEIAILALLREEPMHPYQMQLLLRERHKDEILLLKRGSLYHAINRLVGDKFVEAVSNTRHGRRPERTTYRVTSAGRQQLHNSLSQMIAIPKNEPSEFLGAVSFLLYLTPGEAVEKLSARVTQLESKIQTTKTTIKTASSRVQRINLIESEYRIAMHAAELQWIRRLLAEIRSHKLHWDIEKVFQDARTQRKISATKVQLPHMRIKQPREGRTP